MSCLEIRVGEPEFLNPQPRTSIGPSGQLEQELGEDDSRRVARRASFTLFPVLVHSSSAFPPMSCLEIRVGEPEFLNLHPLPARIRFDWGFF